MGKLFLQVILYLFGGIISLYPIDSVHIKKDLTSILIGESVEFLEDKDHSKTFETIEKEQLIWQKSEKENLVFGFTKSKFWIRFRLKNDTNEKQLLVLDTNFSRIDFIDFYYPDSSGKYIQIQTGDTYPFAKRDVEHYNFAFNIELAPQEEKTFFISAFGKYSVTNITPQIQTVNYFLKNTKKEILFRGVFYGFLLVMVFYNLALFSRIKESVYLYLSLFIAMYLFYFLGFQGIGYQYIFPNSSWLQNRDFHITTPLIIVFSSLFANDFLDLKKNLYRGYLANWFVICLMLFWFLVNQVFVLNYFPQISFHITSKSLFMGVFVALLNAIYLTWKKNRSAYFYLVSWIILLVANIIRFLEVSHIIAASVFTIHMTQFGLCFIIVLLSFGLADKMKYLQEELRKSKEDLEVKVIDRTKELNETLTKVNLLKEKQDGDFFLASLLVEPLAVNKVQKENVKVDFFIKQKKEFHFKTSEIRSIGGDICIAYSLTLRSRNYTVFLNGDAMGKSMQGSSGALILGSLFGSIVNRTQFSSLTQNISPERWMKNAFLEMHKVFEVFDFSMLVSIALGLLDDESGFLYYLNADHPKSVLFRDGYASFIEQGNSLTKLGTLGMKNQIQIQTFQLKAGDSLILGSDGRDDILDETTGNIQWDENIFLKHVEKGNGDLETIFSLIEGSGTIIDDLSLLKVTFIREANADLPLINNFITEKLENFQKEFSNQNLFEANKILEELESIWKGELELANQLAKKYYLMRNYKKSLLYSNIYFEIKQDDLDIIFLISKCLAKDKQLREAIDWSEKIRIRNPLIKKNLYHLYALYKVNGNLDRAVKVLRG